MKKKISKMYTVSDVAIYYWKKKMEMVLLLLSA